MPTDRPPPAEPADRGVAAARFVGDLERRRPGGPVRKVSGWERAARADAIWWAKWGCATVAAGTFGLGCVLVVGLMWVGAQIGAQIGEGLAKGLQQSLTPLVEELEAAAALAAIPAPPAAAGTAEQAAALGPAVAEAWNERDRAAFVRLLNAPSLLRGLVDAELAEAFAAAAVGPNPGDADPERLNPLGVLTGGIVVGETEEAAEAGRGGEERPSSGPAASAAGSEPVPTWPPGVRIVLWPIATWLTGVFGPDGGTNAVPGEQATAAFDGVVTHAGRPAAALLFTSPGGDPDPCDGADGAGPPVVTRVLLIPAPDGRVGSVFLPAGLSLPDPGDEEFSIPPPPPGGETFAAGYRRWGRGILAPMVKRWSELGDLEKTGGGEPGADPARSPAAGDPSP